MPISSNHLAIIWLLVGSASNICLLNSLTNGCSNISGCLLTKLLLKNVSGVLTFRAILSPLSIS